jgi:hypothetical protein
MRASGTSEQVHPEACVRAYMRGCVPASVRVSGSRCGSVHAVSVYMIIGRGIVMVLQGCLAISKLCLPCRLYI